jgi:hypothetical protein
MAHDPTAALYDDPRGDTPAGDGGVDADPGTPGTFAIPACPVFCVGEHRGKPYTDADAADMVANYDLACTGDAPVYRVPVVLGHSEDQAVLKAILSNSDLPSSGWGAPVPGALRVGDDGRTLLLDLEKVHPELARLVKTGAYREVSAEIYDQPPDGMPPGCRGKMIRRIAFLGADPPEVKGLGGPAGRGIPEPVPERGAAAERYAEGSLRPGSGVGYPWWLETPGRFDAARRVLLECSHAEACSPGTWAAFSEAWPVPDEIDEQGQDQGGGPQGGGPLDVRALDERLRAAGLDDATLAAMSPEHKADVVRALDGQAESARLEQEAQAQAMPAEGDQTPGEPEMVPQEEGFPGEEDFAEDDDSAYLPGDLDDAEDVADAIDHMHRVSGGVGKARRDSGARLQEAYLRQRSLGRDRERLRRDAGGVIRRRLDRLNGTDDFAEGEDAEGQQWRGPGDAEEVIYGWRRQDAADMRAGGQHGLAAGHDRFTKSGQYDSDRTDIGHRPPPEHVARERFPEFWGDDAEDMAEDEGGPPPEGTYLPETLESLRAEELGGVSRIHRARRDAAGRLALPGARDYWADRARRANAPPPGDAPMQPHAERRQPDEGDPEEAREAERQRLRRLYGGRAERFGAEEDYELLKQHAGGIVTPRARLHSGANVPLFDHLSKEDIDAGLYEGDMGSAAIAAQRVRGGHGNLVHPLDAAHRAAAMERWGHGHPADDMAERCYSDGYEDVMEDPVVGHQIDHDRDKDTRKRHAHETRTLGRIEADRRLWRESQRLSRRDPGHDFAEGDPGEDHDADPMPEGTWTPETLESQIVQSWGGGGHRGRPNPHQRRGADGRLLQLGRDVYGPLAEERNRSGRPNTDGGFRFAEAEPERMRGRFYTREDLASKGAAGRDAPDFRTRDGRGFWLYRHSESSTNPNAGHRREDEPMQTPTAPARRQTPPARVPVEQYLSQAVAAALEGEKAALKAEKDALAAQRQEFQKFSEQTVLNEKRKGVNALLDRLIITEQRVTPAERDELFVALCEADASRPVQRFSENGHDVTRTAFDLMVRSLERRPVVFSEQVKDGGQDGAPADAEEAKLRAHLGVARFSEGLRKNGSSVDAVVAAFKAEREKLNPNLTAEEFLGR